MQKHLVRPGDTMPGIAAMYGFTDYNLIWNDAQNAALKRIRPNPNILFPNDVVVIPDKEQKTENRGTAKQHVFQLPATTQTLRLGVQNDEGRPIAGTAYVLKVGGQVFTGSTDGSGLLKHDIPLDATDGELTIEGHVWPLQIGHLNPVEKTPDQGVSGIEARLRNLGYDPGPVDDVRDEQTDAAIRAFQRDNGLPEDGKCSPGTATLAKLIEKHGC